MIKAVLFDLDGTLVNSLDDLADSTNFAISSMGFPVHETEKYKYFVGDGINKMLERALPESARDEETVSEGVKRFLSRYSEHFADKTYAYDGMKELVDDLKKIGIKVAVVTNKNQDMAEKVIGKLYGDVFDIVFGKRDGIPPKPDPTSVFMVMSELGVNSDECIFLGDSGMDVKGGANAGNIPVGELWGFREEEELISNGAKFIVSYPNEVLELVKKING